MKKKTLITWSILLACFVLFSLAILNTAWWEAALRFFFPSVPQVIYPGTSLPVLVAEHLELVAVSSLLTILIGVPLGIFVTRKAGRDFMPVLNNLISIGQTFPPVAVLALAVPALGFGALPTIAALFLYGLLPVVRNTIAGLESVPSEVLDAARGLGMGGAGTLLKIEMPLAKNVIMAGIRISVVINIGTAMIGAVIGSGGLGAPVVAGLVQDNLAYIIEGVVPAAVLAILIDQALGNIRNVYPV
jgi:osmoprotectant transport system permease protein